MDLVLSPLRASGVVRMWVRILAWPVAVFVSFSKTLSHNCFVLRMGRKAVHVGPVCCVMHVKESRTLIVKEKGFAPVFLDLRLDHPIRVDMCALQIFCIIIIMYKFHFKNMFSTISGENGENFSTSW